MAESNLVFRLRFGVGVAIGLELRWRFGMGVMEMALSLAPSGGVSSCAAAASNLALRRIGGISWQLTQGLEIRVFFLPIHRGLTSLCHRY